MPQVIVKVDGDKFYYAMNYNARRRHEIGTSCAGAEAITLRCAQEFHRRNPSSLQVTRSTVDRAAHKRKLDTYHDKVCHIRVCKEGNDTVGGFVVLDGELLGLHNIRKGTGDWMMREAVSLGANRLDCFDIPHLIELYERHGFREILREANHTKGQPDVVWMRRN